MAAAICSLIAWMLGDIADYNHRNGNEDLAIGLNIAQQAFISAEIGFVICGLNGGGQSYNSNSSYSLNKKSKTIDELRDDLLEHIDNQQYSNRNRPRCSSIVYDIANDRCYYGRSNWGSCNINAQLESLVPSDSLTGWSDVYNCAEMDAINQALNDGSNLRNLQIYTVYTKTGDSAVMCSNCFYTFANDNISNVYESGFYVLGV